MPRYLKTRGRKPLSIGICDRCRFRVAYTELRPDGDSPGLMVCKSRACWDNKNPWKLPARQPEQITLRNPRPDKRIGFLEVFLVTENNSMILAENGNYIILQDQSDL